MVSVAAEKVTEGIGDRVGKAEAQIRLVSYAFEGLQAL